MGSNDIPYQTLGENLLRVTKHCIPKDSYIYNMASNATYTNSYAIDLQNKNLEIYDIAKLFFDNAPPWVNTLMSFRDKVVSFLKLNLKTAGPLGKQADKKENNVVPKVSKKLNIFTLWFSDDNEIVLGEDDRHLNFRISLKKTVENEQVRIIVSTVIFVNNTLGRLYLFFILPFHKIIVPAILRRIEGRPS